MSATTATATTASTATASRVIVDEKTALGFAFCAYFSNEWIGEKEFIEKNTAVSLRDLLANQQAMRLLGSGEWNVAWGPCCLSVPLSRIADHTIFAVRSVVNPNQLCVSICGTNPLSLFNWFMQDFGVHKMIPWAFAASSSAGVPLDCSAQPLGPEKAIPRISSGTHRGILKLTAMKDAVTKETLVEFLRNEVSKVPDEGQFDVTVTGHSLGGGLAPALALFLYEMSPWWNPRAVSTIHCYSFAGPTIGDDTFARYYDLRLGSGTARIANSLDMVPNAWQESTLPQILTLYEPAIHTPRAMRMFLPIVLKWNANSHYNHICPDQPFFRGSDPVPDRDFGLEAAIQHVRPYFRHAGIEEFAPLLQTHIPLFRELLNGSADLSKRAKIKELFGLWKSGKEKAKKREEGPSPDDLPPV